MKITAEEFQVMLNTNNVNLLEHLVLSSATDEVIKSYRQEKAMDIVLTINGIEVDIMSFLKLFEDQYDQQTALSAKQIYENRIDEVLEPFSEAMDTLQFLWDHIEDEAKKAVAKATDSTWMLDDEEE